MNTAPTIFPWELCHIKQKEVIEMNANRIAVIYGTVKTKGGGDV